MSYEERIASTYSLTPAEASEHEAALNEFLDSLAEERDEARCVEFEEIEYGMAVMAA